MKKIILSCTLLFLLQTLHAQTKHALLIGIGDYDTKATNWNKLNSLRDVEMVKKTLERQMFDPVNIRTVTDAKATKEGIVAAMRDLINRVEKNSKDVVYIHVSSHGAQIEDDNKDETDGLDEAIVTINARWTEDPHEFKKVQGDYLRDDEFGDLIEQLRAKVGKDGDVVVFMDLCHSGTATRGELVARGNKSPLVSAAFAQKNGLTDNLKEFREDSKASRGDNNNLATYVVFSAASANEAAYETYNDDNQKMGALSYAFCKAIENLKDSTSYRSLYAKIAAIVDLKSNIQHPTLEGNGIDRGFLGGQLVLQKPYVEVESVDPDNKTIKIKQGLFSGIDQGSIISFYPAGTSDPEKATLITKGKVIQASQFTADVLVEKIGGEQPKELYAFVTEPVFKIKPIVVKINEDKKKGAPVTSAFNQQEASKLKDQLKPLKQVVFRNENPDLLLIKGESHDSLIVANNGFLFATTERKSLEENLKAYSKYKYLKELEVKDNAINVEVKLGKLKDGKIEFLKPVKTVKGYEYKVGEVMIIAVKNNSQEDVFINVLDFQPDGVVNTIFPKKAPKRGKPIQPSELRIPARQEVIFDSYQITIGPPLGSEVLKVFVSNEMIDMEGLADGLVTRNFKVLMETLVSEAPKVVTRGGDVLSLKEAKGAVFNIPFLIKAK